MSKEQINFRILFRSPKYPVIVIDEDGLWSALNIEELGTICVISNPVDSDKLKVIDTNGEEFWYMPEHYALAPGFNFRKWTKKQIIELFNNSDTAKEEKIQYPLKGLTNKKLSKIVNDICDLLL